MIVATLTMTASLMLAGLEAGVVPGESQSEGEFLYEVYCSTCHGESGKGNGPMARLLRIRPANLRRISARNGGRFPAGEMYHVIDGRRAIRGHGSKDMPLWGYAFQDLDVDLTQEEICTCCRMTVPPWKVIIGSWWSRRVSIICTETCIRSTCGSPCRAARSSSAASRGSTSPTRRLPLPSTMPSIRPGAACRTTPAAVGAP